MSMRKYKNPVNNYFIYNDDIRKSTCKICYFDMAGRHSENLMRHLKRKHPLTYSQVMIEKQRRRAAANADAARQSQKQSGSSDNTEAATAAAATAAEAATGPSSLSSMFKFETEPHKFFIKSEKLAFRLDDPAQQPQSQQQQQQQQQLPLSDDFDNNNDNDDEHARNATYDSVYFGKAELCENLDQTSSAPSHAQCQLTYADQLQQDQDQDQFIITSLSQTATSPSTTAAATQQGSVGAAPGPCTDATPLGSTNDDAYFLQYLGHKFGKYSSSTKSTVQFHINRILYKADMGCYEHVDASKLSDTDL